MISSIHTLPDNTSNRTALTEGDGSVTTWVYDDASRLLTEQRKAGGATSPPAASWDVRYGYDSTGNRTSRTTFPGGSASTTSYSYTPLDQRTDWQYDGRGNLLFDGTTHSTWDAADRLIGATLPGNHSAAYSYDGDGRRVSSTNDGTLTNYVWDEASAYGDVLAETNASGAVQTAYTLGSTDVLAQTANSTTSYLLHDGQGSTRNLTDSTGAISESYLYDAFGSLTSGQTTPKTRYLYTGQQFDPLTGNYSLRARYYSPTQGRFNSRDTADIAFHSPIELNRYGYTANNPVNGFDPTGQGIVDAGVLSLPSIQVGPALAEAGVV